MDISDQISMSNFSPEQRFQSLNLSQQLFLDENYNGRSSPTSKIYPWSYKIEVAYVTKNKKKNKTIRIEYKVKVQEEKLATCDESRTCRICLTSDDTSPLIVPCACKGSSEFIHENCLKQWIVEKEGIEKIQANNIKCEVCNNKIYMYAKFQEESIPSLICKSHKPKIICWVLEIISSLGVISGIIVFIYIICEGNTESYTFACLTILLILLVLLVALIYVSCIEQMTIEVLKEWKFIQYPEIVRRRNQRMKSSILLLNEHDSKVQKSPQQSPIKMKQSQRRESLIQVIQI